MSSKWNHVNSPKNQIKLCRKCRCILNDENLSLGNKNSKNYICRECVKIKAKDFFYKHHDRLLIEMRLRHRKHRLIIDGKAIYDKTEINKREYPKNNDCEICGKTNTRLVYHHWNDKTPNLGVWICNSCHRIVEFSDDERLTIVLNKYHELKTKISMAICLY